MRQIAPWLLSLFFGLGWLNASMNSAGDPLHEGAEAEAPSRPSAGAVSASEPPSSRRTRRVSSTPSSSPRGDSGAQPRQREEEVEARALELMEELREEERQERRVYWREQRQKMEEAMAEGTEVYAQEAELPAETVDSLFEIMDHFAGERDALMAQMDKGELSWEQARPEMHELRKEEHASVEEVLGEEEAREYLHFVRNFMHESR